MQYIIVVFGDDEPELVGPFSGAEELNGFVSVLEAMTSAIRTYRGAGVKPLAFLGNVADALVEGQGPPE